jgi:phosphoglycolate phosphatase-like HAD superfamily hydrolase
MKDAVIADLDGTLCDVSSILHHVEGEERDFASFHAASAGCPAHDVVVEAVRAAHDAGRAVLVVTGREFVWRDLTLDWLVAHNIPYDELVMRIVGDYRPDEVVKAEMLDQLEADGWAISEAWEDSADIVELWESRGITVHAV